MVFKVDKITAFLNKNFNNKYSLSKLKQDASLRQYYRISTEQHSYILMDSSRDQKALLDFVKITNLLQKHELSVPTIILADPENNFLVLEDFGTVSFNDYLKQQPNDTDKLYYLALDNINEVVKIKITDLDLKNHNKTELLDGVKLFSKYYLKETPDILTNMFAQLLAKLDDNLRYLALRDFHADNLMILKNRADLYKIGLLDYQDASKSFLSYDLISLIQDARRQVKLLDQKKYLSYFIDKAKIKNLSKFYQEYEILSFQRNARILGLFTKFAHKGSANYNKYISNVREYLEQNLQSKELVEINSYLKKKLI